MLEIDNQTEIKVPSDKLTSIAKKVLLLEGKEVKDISLLLLDKGKIRSYNKKFRGEDSETDVISFASELAFLPTYGDIIIDLSVADKQRGERSLNDEIQLLFLLVYFTYLAMITYRQGIKQSWNRKRKNITP